MFDRFLKSGLTLSVAFVCSATAQTQQPQTVKPYVGELVMTRTGQLVAPWKEIRTCKEDSPNCVMAIVNPTTREVARLGSRWSTRFKATGNGQEVQRAEAELAKAIRLTPGYAPSKKSSGNE